jgi:hypothetical protein
MASALILLVGALALLVFVLLGIVIELCRDVRQLRDVSGILDRPLDVELGDVRGSRPSAHGLPRALDARPAGVVLFLSDRCGTCHAIAAGLDGAIPESLTLVLEARSPESMREFVAKYALSAGERSGQLLGDADGAIARSLGLRTTPVGFRVEHGRLASATTVPSRRYLESILPSRVRLERAAAPTLSEGVPT